MIEDAGTCGRSSAANGGPIAGLTVRNHFERIDPVRK
jgi:hypothetical protein